MNTEKLAENEKLVNKYHDLIHAIPGFFYLGWSDKEITIYVKPKDLASAMASAPSNLDGIPVKVEPRTNPPSF